VPPVEQAGWSNDSVATAKPKEYVMKVSTTPKLVVATALAVAALGTTAAAQAGLGVPQNQANGIIAPGTHANGLGVPQKHAAIIGVLKQANVLGVRKAGGET